MENKIHKLKTSPEYFQKVWDGLKTFECRLNDRKFNSGDTLILREFDAVSNTYSGLEIEAIIPYVLEDFEGLQTGYAILSLDVHHKYTVKS